MPKISGWAKQVVKNAVEDEFDVQDNPKSNQFNKAYNLKESISSFHSVCGGEEDLKILRQLLSDKVDYIEF